MWLFTPIGFFSIVEKPEDKNAGTLTVRARVLSDLQALKDNWLPSLGPINADAGDDYRYQAHAPKADIAAAMSQLTTSIDYSSFKQHVALRQGEQRAQVYQQLWGLLYQLDQESGYEKRDMQQMDEAPSGMEIPKADAYGGVLINADGKILLREPRNHFGGYCWTFAKGRPDEGESPQQTALREVLEETGQPAWIVGLIPQVFAGTTTSTVFFLMEPEGEPRAFGDETITVCWANQEEARKLIALSPSAAGRARDLAVLAAAYALFDH
jgi:8-oxo-dGTP pyrophosphatase MutT (NUDIX family)